VAANFAASRCGGSGDRSAWPLSISPRPEIPRAASVLSGPAKMALTEYSFGARSLAR